MEEKDTKGAKVYEIGFHIAPIVGDEAVSHEVSGIKAILEKVKAEIISEDFPRLRALSYPLSKKIKGAKKVFDECYFGWVKFEANGDVIREIEKEVEKLENVVRFLIIKTVKENTLYGAKFAAKERMSFKKPDVAVKSDEPKEEVDVVEVDKAIDELIVE
ncbi:MAG: 30S ribosomal protein S6 [Candidatus Paceibacterota bacterium]